VDNDGDEEAMDMDFSKQLPTNALKLMNQHIDTARESELGTIYSVADGEETGTEHRDCSPLPTTKTYGLTSEAIITEPTVKNDQILSHTKSDQMTGNAESADGKKKDSDTLLTISDVRKQDEQMGHNLDSDDKEVVKFSNSDSPSSKVDMRVTSTAQ
jgi:hypothetical protein